MKHQYYFVSNQIIGHSGIVDAEVFAIDRKRTLDIDSPGAHGDRRGKRNRFCYPMELQVTGDGMRGALVSPWLYFG